jgi:hypothetical protein
MGNFHPLRVGIVSGSQKVMAQKYITNANSSELFVNILCGSIPTLKPLYDKWATGRAIVPSKDYKHSGNSGSYRLKDPSNSSKQTSRRFTSRSALSATADNGHYNLDSGEATTVVHSFDVQSKKGSATSTEEII